MKLLSHSLLCALGLTALTACNRSNFGGNKPATEPPKVAKTTKPPVVVSPGGGVISPPEPDGWLPKPVNPVVECGNKTRATRIALVIDTSESMGPSLKDSVKPCDASIGTTQSLPGTDPARIGNSLRGQKECFTDRQNAGWHIVNRVAELDKEATKINPTYNGSEIGIASFPVRISEGNFQDGYENLSNRDPLKSRMTNLGGVTLNDGFKSGVWDILKRTHQSGGVTPYAEALKAGRDLLKTGRDPNDPRVDLLFLVTDGLPTDKKPSEVLKIRKELTDVKVVYLYMFDPGVAEASRNAVAKSSLKTAFEGSSKWGQVDGDGYGPQDFEKYWTDLVALPEKISDTRINVDNPNQLVETLDGLLNITQKCP